jgi:copper chaperone NosL
MEKFFMKFAYPRALLAVLFGLALAACSEPEGQQKATGPVAFHPSDECHVCGMVITDFPGPKGEALENGSVKKFCSTAEMIGWWLQPENRHLDLQLYVHDMGRSQWDTPNDEYLIDARTAYYVAGTQLKGAMGVVLASFADEQAARKLADSEGGQVLRFEEIDQTVLRQNVGMHGHANQHAGH